MPEEEVSSGPAITIEPKPMGMATETPLVAPSEAGSERGGLFQRILSKLHLSGRSPELPPAAVTQTPVPTEMPSALPPQTETPQPPAPPGTGTPTT